MGGANWQTRWYVSITVGPASIVWTRCPWQSSPSGRRIPWQICRKPLCHGATEWSRRNKWRQLGLPPLLQSHWRPQRRVEKLLGFTVIPSTGDLYCRIWMWSLQYGAFAWARRPTTQITGNIEKYLARKCSFNTYVHNVRLNWVNRESRDLRWSCGCLLLSAHHAVIFAISQVSCLLYSPKILLDR